MPQGNFLSTNQKHCQDLGSARHQYGISALFTQTSFYEGSSGDFGCFLRIRIMGLVGAVSVEK